MKTILKKAVSICWLSFILLTTVVTSVLAVEPQSININGENTQFIELFKVENGVTYFPIRLAFNNFEEQGCIVTVVPSIDNDNIAIAVVKINPETGKAIDRRGVYLNWSKDVTNDESFKFGRIELYQYDTDENGNNYLPTENFRRPIALNNSLIFLDVDNNGGQRAFMSLDDLNTMVQFLIDDANYTVKLQ